MNPRFDQVLVFCPDATTGGPEALHQLVGSVNRQGGTARVVYTGPQSKFQILDGVVRCEFDPRSIAFHAYKKYSPVALTETSITPNSLLVFPEISVDFAWAVHSLMRCTVACWWLAVHDITAAHDKAWCNRFMQGPIQLYQSYYAMEFLRSHGAASMFPLFDYTDRNFVRRGMLENESGRTDSKVPKSIAFFPRKGGALAARFFEGLKDSGVDFVPIAIENMTKAEVMEALAKSQVYIDFGHHPGKDRVPREAAAVGNIVVLRNAGAGRVFCDHGVDNAYRFDDGDVMSGALAAVVQTILDDPAKHTTSQQYYRQRIYLEREEFDLQVRQFFFSTL